MLKNREDLIRLRTTYKVSIDAEDKKILVCAGTDCISSGSLEIYDELLRIMKDKDINCTVELADEPHDDAVLGLKKSGCHGFCEMGPLVRIEPQGYLYTKVKISDCEEIINKTIVRGEHTEHLAYQADGSVGVTEAVIRRVSSAKFPGALRSIAFNGVRGMKWNPGISAAH